MHPRRGVPDEGVTPQPFPARHLQSAIPQRPIRTCIRCSGLGEVSRRTRLTTIQAIPLWNPRYRNPITLEFFQQMQGASMNTMVYEHFDALLSRMGIPPGTFLNMHELLTSWDLYINAGTRYPQR